VIVALSGVAPGGWEGWEGAAPTAGIGSDCECIQFFDSAMTKQRL
jgi:hypothetical protein